MARVEGAGGGPAGRVDGVGGDGGVVVGFLLGEMAGRVVAVGLLDERPGRVRGRIGTRDCGDEAVVGVGVGGGPAHRVGDRCEPAGRVVGPRRHHQVGGCARAGRVAGEAFQGGGQRPVVRVVCGVGFGAGRVHRPGFVAVGVVPERGGLAGRVGAAGRLTVTVVGGCDGAGGVAAGRVGDGDRGEVSVVVVGVGGFRGVHGAGDPVGDRRGGLGAHPPGLVIGVGGGQPGRVAVGYDGAGPYPADPVVGVGGDQPGRVGHLGDVAVRVVAGGLGGAARRGDCCGQPGRCGAAPVGRRCGGGVAGRRGAPGREPGHRRGRYRGAVADRVVAHRGQVGVVGGRTRARIPGGQHEVVARVRGGGGGGVVREVGVVGGRAGVGLGLAGRLGHGVAARVVPGGGDRPVRVGNGVQEPGGVVAVCGGAAQGVGLGDDPVVGKRVVGVRERLPAGVGDPHRGHRGRPGRRPVGRPLRGHLGR